MSFSNTACVTSKSSYSLPISAPSLTARSRRSSGEMQKPIAARVFADDVLVFHAAPRRGEVNRLHHFAFGVLVFDDQRIQDVFSHVADESLHQFHHALVIAIGLIRLQHRELGIVFARQAFVAEIAANLEHAVDPADEQPLQVKLQRDAQVKIAAQRVVMRHERLRRRAAGNRLHHRRLDFHEAARMEKLSDLANDFAAHQENVLHFRIRHEIEVALAIANFRVFEPVVFGRRRTQRLGENCKSWNGQLARRGWRLASRILRQVAGQNRLVARSTQLDRDFARLRREQSSTHPDEIAQVKMSEDVPLLIAEDVLLRIDLDAPALVPHVNEHALAHVAMRGDAASDGRLRVLRRNCRELGRSFRPA